MITLDVVSVNGNTALANATYPVYEPNVLYGIANPEDSGQTILVYEDTNDTYAELLVDETVANVVTALTAGNIGQHLGVTFKNKDTRAFAHTGLINLQRIVWMYDSSSDANFAVYSPAFANPIEFITNDVSATIAAGGDAYVEFESHTVLQINGMNIDPVLIYANELYVRDRKIGYGYTDNRQATARALMETETVTLNAGGAGYTALDVLTLVGGTGTSATIRVDTVDGGGAILTFTVLTTGSYITLPGTAAVAVTGGTGTNATFNIDYEVESLQLTDSGNGYRSATVAITGGGGAGATGTVTVANGIATTMAVTAPGNNFTSVPTVTISAPNVGDAILVAPPEKVGKLMVY